MNQLLENTWDTSAIHDLTEAEDGLVPMEAEDFMVEWIDMDRMDILLMIQEDLMLLLVILLLPIVQMSILNIMVLEVTDKATMERVNIMAQEVTAMQIGTDMMLDMDTIETVLIVVL